MKTFVFILHMIACALVIMEFVSEIFSGYERMSDLLLMGIWVEVLAIFFKLDIDD